MHQQLTYIPSSITSRAYGFYFFTLVITNLLFMNHVLGAWWWLFGIVGATLFFIGSSRFTSKWHVSRVSESHFVINLFWMALLIRVIYVLLVSWFYVRQCGDIWGYLNQDPTFYNDVGKDIAAAFRDGSMNLIEVLRSKYGYGSGVKGSVSFSDIGFCIYVGIIYFLTGDLPIIERLLNCVWSAWTVVLIYRLAQRNFGESTGRMAAILCMCMPNLIYYCGTGLKEVIMVFLTVLFAERADNLLRQGKLATGPIIELSAIAFAMFTIRTPLAVTLVLSFITALIFANSRMVSWARRSVMIVLALLFMGTIYLQNTTIRSDVRSLAEERSGQKANMEWRATRDMGKGTVQRFAKYAGAAVFAPLIFTLPFPTMVNTYGQEQQQMLNGGNYCKNIMSYFTILAMFMLLLSGDWRNHVLPIALMCGYLVILTFSNFAQSERFHQPVIPFELMFAAYAISHFKDKAVYANWFTIWTVMMMVAAVMWNWFKLAGRGLV